MPSAVTTMTYPNPQSIPKETTVTLEFIAVPQPDNAGCAGCVGRENGFLCGALPDCWEDDGNIVFKLKPVA